MLFSGGDSKLCWMQRIALIRYNLHSAVYNHDFTFFKTLQAQAFVDGTDCVSALQATLGDEADSVLHTLDDLNAGIGYVHQDGYKALYDSVRSSMTEDKASRLSKLCVDVYQQKKRADFAIDKMANSAIELVQQQPADTQDLVTAVWIIGATIVADAIKVCIDQIDELELYVEDFVRLECSWHTVQTAVEASVSAIRGIFSLMAAPDAISGTSPSQGRSMSISSTTSNTSSVMRRLSNAFFHSPLPNHSAHCNTNMASLMQIQPIRSRNPSISSMSSLRASVSSAFPNQMPASRRSDGVKLSPIPPTPFGALSESINPFDMTFERSKSIEDVLQMQVSIQSIDCHCH